jgi:shikimate dehydrogenase
MTTALRFAVIGHPIHHSRSPDIHLAFAKQFGIDLQYDRIDPTPERFESVVERFFSQGGVGLNVTVPFKELAWQLASKGLSARARDAQAVNTLWQQAGQIQGCNTDGVGLVSDLQRLGVPLSNANILMIGAGGAARGVLGPLLDSGCTQLFVVNRTAQRAQTLVGQWIEKYPDDANRLSAGGLDQIDSRTDWQLVINATSSSLQGQAMDLAGLRFTAHTHAYDMMYGAEPTAFLRQAQQAGCHHLADGLGMLVSQAAESFAIWLNQRPAVEPVIAAMRNQLALTVR